MLRVRVEILPGGDESRAREILSMTAENDGTGQEVECDACSGTGHPPAEDGHGHDAERACEQCGGRSVWMARGNYDLVFRNHESGAVEEVRLKAMRRGLSAWVLLREALFALMTDRQARILAAQEGRPEPTIDERQQPEFGLPEDVRKDQGIHLRGENKGVPPAWAQQTGRD